MKQLTGYILPVVIVLGILCFASCEKDSPPNPFDPYNQTDTTGNIVDTTNPVNFASLHKNIFVPTCANSGCHDGTFEPDFRTIESSYNTLVYHPIIKNDTLGTYSQRVIPGDVNNSILYVRLTEDLNGNSGIMPLSIDPGSDWPEKKDDYIQNIRDWISNGAKDQFGNDPVVPNKEPEMLGVTAFADGSNTPVNRRSNGSMMIPLGTTSLDVWFAFSDDVTPSANLQYNKVKFSQSLDDFENVPEQDLVTSATKQAEGFDGSQVTYTHKIKIDPFSLWNPGSDIFVRAYVQDAHNGVTEIPEFWSAIHIKTYFTLSLSSP